MKYFYLFFLISNSVYSQFNVEYDIYLKLNSEKSTIHTETVNDSITLTSFSLSKSIPKEGFKYLLGINRKGELATYLPSNPTHKKNSHIYLFYSSLQNKKKQVLKISNVNFIDYDIISSTKFSSLVDVLKKARKIYIINLSEENLKSNFYTAYEVRF